MSSIKKSWTVLTLVVVFATLMAACAPQVVEKTVEVEKEVEVTREVEVEVEKIVEITPTPRGPQGTLRVAMPGLLTSLTPGLHPDTTGDNALAPMFDTMVEITEENEFAPKLAESWEISDDGTEYTFHLREGVTFHNGEPFTADDVIASWEFGQRDEMNWQYAWKRAEAEKIDDYTVKLTLAEPNAIFLRSVAYSWYIIPGDYVDEVGFDGFQEHPVGAGPFMFVEWVKGDHVTYKAYPDYWREGYPKVENLILKPIPDSATRAAAVQAGEVDIAPRLNPEDAMRLIGTNVSVLKYPLTRLYYIAFNNLTTGVGEPTEDAKVRLAMNYAVDVDMIVSSILGGYAKSASGMVASGEMGFANLDPYGYDPDKAKELLAEAGYPDGFSMGMACPPGIYPHFEEVCEAIAGYLGDVGIDVPLEIMEVGQFWSQMGSKELPPLYGDSWNSLGEAYDRLAGSMGGMDATYSAWADPRIDEYLARIETAVDPEDRAKVYEEIQVFMQEDPPFIYLYEQMGLEGVNLRVHDYIPLPNEYVWFTGTWVDPEE